MRIKQIELNGFKSFMERTVLELPPGITGIVGPNGCGKSNVVDAIRWVLGEQSPKHLRGGSMEDVIFNGNAENGPLGMAEVSLLLERDDTDFARAAEEASDDEAHGGLPAELARASEILVTRRYFRSGDSEYFINRAACRLKDITELFLGTGVGSKAYAIVEQGRVDQLVNAKPEDMRSFIEEAAGTTRFRSRKHAAERKMIRTRENLLRVQDVLREIERQMALLERQARRAEEYHRLKGELRELAGMLARDHGAANDRLSKLAESKGWPLPAPHAPAPVSAAGSSADFDARFTAAMIAGHEKSLALYRAQARNGDDRDLRRFASETLPTIEHHLAELRSLQK